MNIMAAVKAFVERQMRGEKEQQQAEEQPLDERRHPDTGHTPTL